MQGIEYWKLCDSLSVVEATLLMLDLDPADNHEFLYSNHVDKKAPKGFTAIQNALLRAAEDGEIQGTLGYQDTGGYGNDNYLCPQDTCLKVHALKDFLRRKDYKCDFFNDGDFADAEFSDSDSEFYAPKLAAAVKVWEAVSTNPDLTNGKTPKQALEKWLKENAQKYDLFLPSGDHNRTAIEEIAKIANWKPGGGAAKTPVRKNPPTPEPIENEDENDFPF